MIATVVVALQIALAVDRAAELTGKHDDRVVQQTALFQVAQQRRGRLVDVEALAPQLLRQNRVVIPAPVKDLDEAHTAFDHPPGEQAVAGKGSVLVDFRSVQVHDVLRFSGDVRQFGNGRLHAEGHFLLGDGGLNLGIADLGEVLSVQLAQRVEHPAADAGVDAAGIRQKQDRISRQFETRRPDVWTAESRFPTGGCRVPERFACRRSSRPR